MPSNHNSQTYPALFVLIASAVATLRALVMMVAARHPTLTRDFETYLNKITHKRLE